jgi:hypothetical protein
MSRDAAVRKRLRALAAPLPIAAFTVIGFSWFAAACVSHPGLLRHWIEVELLGRTIGDAHSRNAGWHQPLKLWLPALTAGTLPWCLTWPPLLARGSRAPSASRRQDDRAALARRFAWCWIIVTFALFTLARSRGMLYVLPAFPAIALLTTCALLDRARARQTSARTMRRILVAGAAAAILLLGLRGGLARVPSHRDGRAHAALVAGRLDREPAAVIVAGRPLHSLAHYLRAPVEWRPVGQSAGRVWPARAPRESSIDDLVGRPGRLLIVASDDVAESVTRSVENAGRAFTARRTPLRRTIVVVEAEDPAGAGPQAVAADAPPAGLSAPGRTSGQSLRRDDP